MERGDNWRALLLAELVAVGFDRAYREARRRARSRDRKTVDGASTVAALVGRLLRELSRFAAAYPKLFRMSGSGVRGVVLASSRLIRSCTRFAEWRFALSNRTLVAPNAEALHDAVEGVGKRLIQEIGEIPILIHAHNGWVERGRVGDNVVRLAVTLEPEMTTLVEITEGWRNR